MTYQVGDDATQSYPVTDTDGSTLEIPTTVVARRWLGDTETITAAWNGTAAAHPTLEGATLRWLDVPLDGLPPGPWTLHLTIAGAADLRLGKVTIQ